MVFLALVLLYGAILTIPAYFKLKTAGIDTVPARLVLNLLRYIIGIAFGMTAYLAFATRWVFVVRRDLRDESKADSH